MLQLSCRFPDRYPLQETSILFSRPVSAIVIMKLNHIKPITGSQKNQSVNLDYLSPNSKTRAIPITCHNAGSSVGRTVGDEIRVTKLCKQPQTRNHLNYTIAVQINHTNEVKWHKIQDADPVAYYQGEAIFLFQLFSA